MISTTALARALRTMLIGAVITLGSTQLIAQAVSGRVVGTIRDSSGAVLPNALVVLSQTSTGFERTARTSATGDYVFTFIPAGTYTVKADAEGFKATSQDVTLDVMAAVRADFDLTLATAQTTVEIKATAPQLHTETSEVGEVVNQRGIQDLPLNGRQFSDLIRLNSGVTISAGGTSDVPLLQTGLNLNVNGMRPTHNQFSIDGVTATDYYFSHLSALLSVDAINEFKVLAGQYSAEFGGKGGGQVNVVTKAGTNAFHGTVFEFLRNNVLDEPNHFAAPGQPAPPYKQNNFGSSLGGPVLRNRLFFFANYEGSRIRQTLSQLATVPTEAMRAGNFQGLNPIYNPTIVTGQTRQQFPNNQILPSQFDNAAKIMLALLPTPTLPGIANNYRSVGLRSRNDDQGTIRADYQAGQKDSAFGRLSVNNIESLEPFGARGNNALPGFPSSVTTVSRNAALNYTHLFTSKLVGNALIGFNRVSGGIATLNQSKDIGNQANIAVLNTIPASLRGVPAVSTSFISAFGDDTSTLLRTDNTYQFSGQFFYNTGAHSISFGFEAMRHQFNPYTPIFARGSYSFSGTYTASTVGGSNGNGFADFLLGYPFSATLLVGNALENARATWYGTYVQDNLRVSSRLTLNLGLRYDLMLPFYDTGNRLSTIDLKNSRVVVASSGDKLAPEANIAQFGAGFPLPFVTSSQAGFPRSLLQTDKTNFAPRLGFAYRALDRVVLRGGYAIVYSVPPLNLQARMDRNPPFSGLISANNTPTPSFTTESIFAGSQSAPSFGFLIPDFRNSRVQQYSVGVEGQVLGSFVVGASYVGTKTDFLDWMGPGNPAHACTLPCAALESRRVYPGLGNFTITNNEAYANYNALQLRAEQRYSNGLYYLLTFTWAKSLDNSSSSSGDNNSVTNDPFNLAGDYGPSSFDHRLAFTASYGYELPFGRKRRFLNNNRPLDWIVGGWQLGGIITARTGEHLTVGISTCPANTGSGCRTDLVGDPNSGDGIHTEKKWFNTSVFRPPAQGQFGNEGRNIIIGPGLFDWDFSAHKSFAVREGIRIELRGEIFNITNAVNYANPNTTLGSAAIGTISSAAAARQVQLGLKLLF